jgi:SAM-dependent methyltransferase
MQGVERYNAIKSSLQFDPNGLGFEQFIRFAYYLEIERWATGTFLPKVSNPKIIEFGGSNGTIARIFGDADYTISPNWPDVDIQDLKQYQSEAFDLVVIDQILEHVQDPQRAVSEIWRVLKPGGVCLCATPFLIKIHGSYGDYWRFTELGLKSVFSRYSKVEVSSWGNRFTLETTIREGWLDCNATKRRLKVALWNEPEWPIVYLTKAVK